MRIGLAVLLAAGLGFFSGFWLGTPLLLPVFAPLWSEVRDLEL